MNILRALLSSCNPYYTQAAILCILTWEEAPWITMGLTSD